jgi:hypothetical protein
MQVSYKLTTQKGKINDTGNKSQKLFKYTSKAPQSCQVFIHVVQTVFQSPFATESERVRDLPVSNHSLQVVRNVRNVVWGHCEGFVSTIAYL